MTITFNVRNQHIEISEKMFIASESINYLDCKFCFSEEWTGFEKTAVFSNIDGSYSVLLDSDICSVPHEVLSGNFNVSVFGTQSGTTFRRITTNAAPVMVSESGYREGDTPDEPTPDVYETIISNLAAKEEQIKAAEEKNTQLGNELSAIKKAVTADKAAIEAEIADCRDEIKDVKIDLDKLPDGYAAKTHIHKSEDITDLNIPAKTSQLENDSGFVADESYVHTDNNYTDADALKLAGLHNYDDTAIKSEIDEKADIPSTVASGQQIILTDHLENEPILSCRIYGNDSAVGDLKDSKYHIPVKICGKNKIPYPYLNTTKTQAGIVWTDNGDGTISANGTATNNTDFHLCANENILERTFVLSGVLANFPEGAIMQIWEYTNSVYKKGTTVSADGTVINLRDDTDKYIISVVIKKGTTCNVTFYPQMESGTAATEYEPYTDTTATAVLDTPLAAGEHIDIIRKKRVSGSTESDITVTGELKTIDSCVNSIICNTTVSPSKMDTEYYQDINKVIAEIKNAILSQGGNV